MIEKNHHYTNNTPDTCAAGLRGGCDNNCGSFYSGCGVAVTAGTITEADVDLALGRTLKSRFRLGQFDAPSQSVYTSYNQDDIWTPEHQALALLAAQESIVLLKNDGNLLPLSKSSVKSIAIVGPNADAPQTQLGNYNGEPPVISTPRTAFAKYATVNYAKGCDINSTNVTGIPAAVAAAKQSDVAVVFLGLDPTLENEMHDRYEIDLPGAQYDLVKAVVATGKPVVVVLMNGGPVAHQWVKDNVPAIVEAFYPGEAGGTAIASVLFGEYNPAGRLPYTIYPPEYVDQVPMTSMSMRAYPGRTYKFYQLEPQYPFGHGLSYTSFRFDWGHNELASRSLSISLLAAGELHDSVSYVVNVTNTGSVAGDVVVLGFIASNQPQSPKQELFDFQRVINLKPAQTVQVFLGLSTRVLSRVLSDGSRSLVPGSYQINIDALNGSLELHGDEKTLTPARTV